MAFGSGGGGGTDSRPLTAAERTELYEAAMSQLGPYMPKASDYQGYSIVDPSADRGRGVQADGLTGYAGYSNVGPRTLKDANVEDYYKLTANATRPNMDTVTSGLEDYLNNYFAERDRQEAERANYGGW